MDLELAGKAAIVTGGSRGIGRAIALGLAAEGVNVALVARTLADLERAADEVRAEGVQALPLPADVTDHDAMRDAVARVSAKFGRLDIVVNNAGGRAGTTIDDTSLAEVQAGLDINFMSAVRTSKLALPHLRARGGGAVVNIASIWGKESGGVFAYNAAKAAMISFTKAMAREFAAEHIRVNAVAPGSIYFPGGGWAQREANQPDSFREVLQTIPAGRMGRPEEVAHVVVFLASPRASWINGACVVVDGCQSVSNI